MSSRFLAMTAATLAVFLSIVGCGVEVRYDPETSYTVESLAKEFSFRYKWLDRPTTAAPADKPEGPVDKPEGPVDKPEAVTRGVDATKSAPVHTLDDLIEDTIGKAATIRGLYHAQACKKVAEIIAKDPLISEADRKKITEKLGAVTD